MARIVYATYNGEDYSVTFSAHVDTARLFCGDGEIWNVAIESATILGVEHAPHELKSDLHEALLDKVSELSGSEWSE